MAIIDFSMYETEVLEKALGNLTELSDLGFDVVDDDYLFELNKELEKRLENDR